MRVTVSTECYSLLGVVIVRKIGRIIQIKKSPTHCVGLFYAPLIIRSCSRNNSMCNLISTYHSE